MSASDAAVRQLYASLFGARECPPALIARYHAALPRLAQQDERTQLQLIAYLAETDGQHQDVFAPPPQHWLRILWHMAMALLRRMQP